MPAEPTPCQLRERRRLQRIEWREGGGGNTPTALGYEPPARQQNGGAAAAGAAGAGRGLGLAALLRRLSPGGSWGRAGADAAARAATEAGGEELELPAYNFETALKSLYWTQLVYQVRLWGLAWDGVEGLFLPVPPHGPLISSSV